MEAWSTRGGPGAPRNHEGHSGTTCTALLAPEEVWGRWTDLGCITGRWNLPRGVARQSGHAGDSRPDPDRLIEPGCGDYALAPSRAGARPKARIEALGPIALPRHDTVGPALESNPRIERAARVLGLPEYLGSPGGCWAGQRWTRGLRRERGVGRGKGRMGRTRKACSGVRGKSVRYVPRRRLRGTPASPSRNPEPRHGQWALYLGWPVDAPYHSSAASKRRRSTLALARSPVVRLRLRSRPFAPGGSSVACIETFSEDTGRRPRGAEHRHSGVE